MIWIIGIGGMIGAILRYVISVMLEGKTKYFPLATWFVNISGSFLLGLLWGLYINHSITNTFWLFCGVGLLGSFTTMSTFGFESVKLLKERKYKQAALYVISSVLISLCLIWIGWRIVNGF